VGFGCRQMLSSCQLNRLLEVVNDQCSYHIKTCVPNRYINQGAAPEPLLLQECVDKDNDFGHDQRTDQVLRRLLSRQVVLSENRGKGQGDETERKEEERPNRKNFIQLFFQPAPDVTHFSSAALRVRITPT